MGWRYLDVADFLIIACMVEFIERNGRSLNVPTDGPELDAFEELLANVASRAVSEAEFASWIAAGLSKVEPSAGDR